MKELRIGTKLEMEHKGTYRKIRKLFKKRKMPTLKYLAKNIAQEHIKEYPNYYTDKEYGLIEMEKELKEEKNEDKKKEIKDKIYEIKLAKFNKSKHRGDYVNYPVSNMLADKGIRPDHYLDKDTDLIIDYEDCEPYNAKKQGDAYQGPTRPSDNQNTYRDTGTSTGGSSNRTNGNTNNTPQYQGPTRPTDNPETFRNTGHSSGSSSNRNRNTNQSTDSGNNTSSSTANANMVNANSIYILDKGKVVYDANRYVGNPTYGEFKAREQAVKDYYDQASKYKSYDPNLIKEYNDYSATQKSYDPNITDQYGNIVNPQNIQNDINYNKSKEKTDKEILEKAIELKSKDNKYIGDKAQALVEFSNNLTYEDAKEILKSVYKFYKDMTISTGKGYGKTMLYFGDELNPKWAEKDKLYGEFTNMTDYNKDVPFYRDKDIQTAGIVTATGIASSGVLGSIGIKGAKLVGKGFNIYATGKFLTNPTTETAGEAIAMGFVPKAIEKLGYKAERIKAYNDKLKELETKYGKNSVEVKDFKDTWNRAFYELIRNKTPIKEWDAKKIEAIANDIESQKIVTNYVRKNAGDIKIVGTSGITPQTTLTEPPRGLSGDIDIAKGNEKFITGLYKELKEKGKNVKLTSNKDTFTGKGNVYHLNINGKEFINLHENAIDVTFSQIRRHMNLFDRTKKAWAKDKYGVEMLNIRDQMRAKEWAGYIEKSRPKDILDVKGIKEGTDKLIDKPTTEYGLIGKDKNIKVEKNNKEYLNKDNTKTIEVDEYLYNDKTGKFEKTGKKIKQEVYDYKNNKDYYNKIVNKDNYNKYKNNKDNYNKYGNKENKYGKYNKPYKYYGGNPPYPYPNKPEPNYPYNPYYKYPKIPEKPNIPIIPNIPKIEKEKKIGKLYINKDKEKGYRPIIIDKDGKEFPLDLYQSEQQALSEGTKYVDENQEYIFRIQKELDYLKKIKQSKIKNTNRYKIKKTNGIYVERRRYRKDSPNENNSWTKLLRR